MATTTHVAHQPATWDLHAYLGADASSATGRELPRAAEPMRLPSRLQRAPGMADCAGGERDLGATGMTGLCGRSGETGASRGRPRAGGLPPRRRAQQLGDWECRQENGGSGRSVLSRAASKTEAQGRSGVENGFLRTAGSASSDSFSTDQMCRMSRLDMRHMWSGLTCHTQVTQSESRRRAGGQVEGEPRPR